MYISLYTFIFNLHCPSITGRHEMTLTGSMSQIVSSYIQAMCGLGAAALQSKTLQH